MAVRASSAITLSCVVDVWSTTRYYLLQASTLSKPTKPTANPPGGAWSDMEPGYTAGSTNTLYFVDLTVFSDQTWAYSLVSVSSAYEAAKVAYNKAQAAQNIATDARDAADRALSSTEVIVGTQTAATGAWKGTASFAQLHDGQVILYWLPVAGNGNATLELTLSGGGTTGAKNVYIDGTTRCTTHISAGNMAQMVYRENVSIGGTAYTGWWISRTRNDNNYDRVRFNNAIKARTAIMANYLIVGDENGFYHLAAGSAFDINKPILWAASAISAGVTGTNNYLSYPGCTLRNNAGSAWTGTQYQTVYLAGALQGSSFIAAAENWLTTEPANEELTYIALGYMYSTYQMYLYPEHPMYRLADGVLTAVSQMAFEALVTAEQAQTSANNAQDTATAALETAEETRALVEVESDGLHVRGYRLDEDGARLLTGGEVLVAADGMHVVVGGQVYSRFASDYVEFGNYQLRRVNGGLAFKLRKTT